MDDRDRRRIAAALAAAQRARRHVAYFGEDWERIEAAVDAIAKAIEDVGEQLTGTLQQPGVSAETRAAHPEILALDRRPAQLPRAQLRRHAAGSAEAHAR